MLTPKISEYCLQRSKKNTKFELTGRAKLISNYLHPIYLQFWRIYLMPGKAFHTFDRLFSKSECIFCEIGFDDRSVAWEILRELLKLTPFQKAPFVELLKSSSSSFIISFGKSIFINILVWELTEFSMKLFSFRKFIQNPLIHSEVRYFLEFPHNF